MNKFLVSISLLLTTIMIVGCGRDNSRRDATTVGEDGWIFEGWACAPNTAEAKKGKSPADYCTGDSKSFDYLYMKFMARASERAIQANSIAMKMSTCRRAANDQIAGDALEKIIGRYLEQASGVSDGQSTGHAIVSNSKGKISGIGIYDCCSIDKDTASCAKKGEKELWEDCACVGYLRYPGGQKAFMAAAKE